MRTLATIALGMTLTWGCGATSEPAGDGPAAATAVTVARAARVELPSYVEVGGIVQPRSTAFVSSRVAATVEAVYVVPGDRVTRGQMLVRLDRRELAAHAARAAAERVAATEAVQASEAAAAAAEAELRLAETTLTRITELHGKQSATQQELDRAVAARDGAAGRARAAHAARAAADASGDAARAAEDAARVADSYSVLSAPFDGVVAERLVDEGALALPGTPLLLLEERSTPRLEVRIDDTHASRLLPGVQAEVRLDGQAATWTPARVVEIGRSEPATHSFLVTLEIDGQEPVRSGTFGRARFAWEARTAVTVPAGSVLRRGQLSLVYLVDAAGRARLRPVVTGAAGDGDLEILTGLQDGDTVVVAPPVTLADGSRVELAASAPADGIQP